MLRTICCYGPCLGMGYVAVVAVGLLGVVEAAAQGVEESSGLQLLTAIEEVFTETIARNERSVVSIARVRKETGGAPVIEPRFDPFRQRPGLSRANSDPSQIDFVPSEYGTGVVVDSRGLVLTAYHVLGEDCDHYVTTADRKTYAARIKGADPRSDLAVLEIDADDLVPVRFGDASTLRKGQIVIALGNPYAISRDGQASACWGMVSNLARKLHGEPGDPDRPLGKPKLQHVGWLIRTDAKLHLGTSGGPLLNLRGEMIGLTTALAAIAGYEQGAGFAVPVDDTFRRVVDALVRGREVEYGFLGVSPENLDAQEIRGGKHGARITAVMSGTPADRFGLRQYDVVSAVNGEPIYDADGLVYRVGRLPVESVVKLTVEREGRPTSIDVELAKYPVDGKKIITTPEPPWRGLNVDYFTADKRLVGVINELASEGVIGVVVTAVEDNSPAWRAELRTGMLISHVGGVPVQSPKQFHAAVAGRRGAVPVRVSVVPGRPEERIVEPEAG